MLLEKGAGLAAGYPDQEYLDKGAELAPDRSAVYQNAQLIAVVRGLGAHPDGASAELGHFKKGQVLVGFLDPLGHPELAQPTADKGITSLSMELIPRITRAQNMDALSSMANIAGYRAVLLAATHLPKLFPMMMTAAGTISPAKVFVLGAGVAGLQAIATAKRLGAVVHAYDIRPEVKDQVVSVGGKFLEIKLESEEAGDSGGYAKAQSEEFYKKQQEMMGSQISASDVVITTAAIPGRRAPVLVTEAMVHRMSPGSVIVDLAAETGGNCELTQAGVVSEVRGVCIVGPVNIPSDLPFHASQMYSRNVVNLLNLLTDKEGTLNIDQEDEVIAAALVTHEGSITSTRVSEALSKRAS